LIKELFIVILQEESETMLTLP